jgi:Fic family protein
MNSLHHSPIGSTVPITGHDARFGEDFKAEAYIPHDLPSNISLPASTWMKLTEAAAELGRLDSAAQLVPTPELIARVATRREAVGTSALEGTYADLTDVFAAEVTPKSDRLRDLPPNVSEVINYTRAAEQAYKWIPDRPITLGLLCSLQALIVAGTPTDGEDAGALRSTQVFIGARDRRVTEARFIPPPPGDSLRAMCERWIAWLSDPAAAEQIPLIARVAMAHYQFETLHPFTDGNGRLGRLVAVLQLLREGALRSPVLAVSPWLEERADDYRDHLLGVSVAGEWAPWIEFFADAVRDESQSGHERIMRLLSLRDELVELVRNARPRAGLALEITESLIAAPMLSVSDAQRRYGRSNQANRNAIEMLVELGVLEPYSSERYDRLYWSRRVFQVINA